MGILPWGRFLPLLLPRPPPPGNSAMPMCGASHVGWVPNHLSHHNGMVDIYGILYNTPCYTWACHASQQCVPPAGWAEGMKVQMTRRVARLRENAGLGTHKRDGREWQRLKKKSHRQ